MCELTRIGKTQYAEKLGITVGTLARMLNVEFYSEMKRFGYKKNQKHLTKAQIRHFEYITVNLACNEDDIKPETVL